MTMSVTVLPLQAPLGSRSTALFVRYRRTAPHHRPRPRLVSDENRRASERGFVDRLVDMVRSPREEARRASMTNACASAQRRSLHASTHTLTSDGEKLEIA